MSDTAQAEVVKPSKPCCSGACIASMVLSLRTKTVVALIILIAILIGSFLAVILGVFPPSFLKIENDSVTDAGERVQRALFEDMSSMVRGAVSFASWNATYDLAIIYPAKQNGQSVLDHFINNWTPSSIAQNDAHFIAMYDRNGNMLINRTYDFDAPSNPYPFAVPPSLQKLESDNALMGALASTATRAAAFVELVNSGNPNFNNKIMLLISSPVTTAEFGGIIPSIVVMGKVMNNRNMLGVAQKVQLCCSFHAVSQASSDIIVSDYFKPRYVSQSNLIIPTIANSSWNNGKSPMSIDPLNLYYKSIPNRQCYKGKLNEDFALKEDRLGAFYNMGDYTGKNTLFIMAIDVPRPINYFATISIAVAASVIAVISVFSCTIILVFVECCVLRPIIRLGTEVQEIGASSDIAKRVKVTSGDELGRTGININRMLDSMQASQDQIIQEKDNMKKMFASINAAEERSRAIMDAIPDYIISISSDGIILQTNYCFTQDFGYEQHQTVGVLNISKVIPKLSLEEIFKIAEEAQSREAEAITAHSKTLQVQVEVTEMQIFVDDLETKAYVVLARNISEAKEARRVLEEEKKRLAELQGLVAYEIMMKSADQRVDFRKYCENQNSVEYFLFTESVEEFKTIKQLEARQKKHVIMLEKFFKVTSPFPMSIPKSPQNDLELNKINKGSGAIDVFDALELTVKKILIEDVFKRWHQVWQQTHPSD